MKASNLSEVYEIFDPQEPLKDEKLKEYCVEQVESYDLHVDEIHLNGTINLLEVLLNWGQTSEDTVYFYGVRMRLDL